MKYVYRNKSALYTHQETSMLPNSRKKNAYIDNLKRQTCNRHRNCQNINRNNNNSDNICLNVCDESISIAL